LRGNTSAVREHLPLAVSGFLRQHPQIALELQECPSSEVLAGLRQGLCDIGVAAWDAEDSSAGRPALPALEADPLAAALPLGHALAGRSQLKLAELLHEALVGLPRESALQQLLQKQALRINDRLLRIQVQLQHFEGLCQLVGQGVGIAVLPLAAVQRHGAATGVAAVPLSDAWAQRQLLLCTPPGRHPCPCLRGSCTRSCYRLRSLSKPR
jgi:DNA-binding transcriptional LysR family regulator